MKSTRYLLLLTLLFTSAWAGCDLLSDDEDDSTDEHPIEGFWQMRIEGEPATEFERIDGDAVINYVRGIGEECLERRNEATIIRREGSDYTLRWSAGGETFEAVFSITVEDNVMTIVSEEGETTLYDRADFSDFTICQ